MPIDVHLNGGRAKLTLCDAFTLAATRPGVRRALNVWMAKSFYGNKVGAVPAFNWLTFSSRKKQNIAEHDHQ
jgi:hypothetical protein